jgi:GntR family transcriptional regulator
VLQITVDPRSDVPPSRQLVEAILDALARGVLGRDDRLPSVRVLAAEALVNPNTVGKAYRDLEVLGVVEGRNGSGVYVTGRGPALASAQRREATLARLVEAAAAALRAGHEPGDLRRALDEAAAPSEEEPMARRGYERRRRA